MLCITDRVVGAKICSEFMSEPRVIIHPPGAEVGIAQQELGLEPIERHALEIGLGVDDLCAVIVEGPRAVLKVKLALHEERCRRVGLWLHVHTTIRNEGQSQMYPSRYNGLSALEALSLSILDP